ncbi:MAG: FecR domain-containing protein [Bradyrhizobium sp.]|nr:FecR domain-containing protein [Bradyrhizobium sp.]
MPSEFDPLLRQALAWVVRLNSGEATSDDAAALELWRSRSPEHEAAFRHAVRLWRSLGDATRKLVADRELPRDISEAQRPRPRLSRRSLLGAALAASVAGYLVVRPPFGLWPSFDELSADYRTAKGEQRHVTLSDDIALTLNTQTSIAVRSASGEPRIELIAGEAAVSAQRQAQAPLIVDAAGGRISAYQANFNVKCLDHVVSVLCLDGTVDVAWKGHSLSMQGGHQVSYSAAGLGTASAVDPELGRAWQHGLLIVRDWPVGRLVEEINRYRPGKIVLMNTDLGRRMISGTFHLDHLDDFIGQAHGLFGATARALPGGIVLLS